MANNKSNTTEERIAELREMHKQGTLGRYVRTEMIGIGPNDYARESAHERATQEKALADEPDPELP